jgi:hypothetical protein
LACNTEEAGGDRVEIWSCLKCWFWSTWMTNSMCNAAGICYFDNFHSSSTLLSSNLPCKEPFINRWNSVLWCRWQILAKYCRFMFSDSEFSKIIKCRIIYRDQGGWLHFEPFFRILTYFTVAYTAVISAAPS